MSKAALLGFLDAVAKRLKDEQVKKGIRASGRSAKSLRSRATDTTGQLTGDAYFQQQEEGRGPTKKPGPGVLVGQIRRWIDDKGLGLWDGFRTKDAMAWVITRKIHREGTRRGRDPKYPGLPVSGIIAEERDKLFETYGALRLKAFASEIAKKYR